MFDADGKPAFVTDAASGPNIMAAAIRPSRRQGYLLAHEHRPFGHHRSASEEAVTSLSQNYMTNWSCRYRVLLDDRDARPGFKFKDAELIGFPIRLTVGKKGLAEGIVELQIRRTGESQKVAPDQIVATVRRLVDDALRIERT
jgi:prolyl-tRNA synthetase